MRLTIQVIVSLLMVVAVLWFMWRLPRRGERYFGWAPPLALISAWAGLFGVAATGMLWFVQRPDPWITIAFMFLYPLALTSGVLVLWIYRDYESSESTIAAQRVQAVVGVTLSLAAIVMGYLFVLLHKPPGTTIGQ